MNDVSAVNEKSAGMHKALNASPYRLLTGANSVSHSTYADQSYISSNNNAKGGSRVP